MWVGQWWCTPLVPVWEAGARGSLNVNLVYRERERVSEFHESQGYTEILLLKNKQTNKHQDGWLRRTSEVKFWPLHMDAHTCDCIQTHTTSKKKSLG